MKKAQIRVQLVQTLINDLSGLTKAKFPTLLAAKSAAKLPKRLYTQVESILTMGRDLNQDHSNILSECQQEFNAMRDKLIEEEEAKPAENRLSDDAKQSKMKEFEDKANKSLGEKLESSGYNEKKKKYDEAIKADIEIQLNPKEYQLLAELIRDNFQEFAMSMADLDELTDALGITA